mgnify:FL=1
MSKFNFSNTLGGATFGSLNAFLSHNASRDGYSKPNRYEVMIYLPAGVSGASVQDAGESATNVKGLKNSEAARRVSFRCDSISIPGRNLRTQINGNIYGPPHEVVQGITFGELQATFYLGNDLGERYFFEEWQKTTYNPTTYNINYYKEYVGALEIYQLNEQDERTYGCRLVEVFPKTISQIDYGHGNSNAINKITVGFMYRYWENIATDEKKASLEGKLQDILANSILRQVQTRVPNVLRRLF